MKRWIIITMALWLLCVPARAENWTAPPADAQAQAVMPQESAGFLQDALTVLRSALQEAIPVLRQGMGVCLAMVASMLLLTVVYSFSGPAKRASELAAVVVLSCLLLESTGGMILLGEQTLQRLSEYVKLLLPALAAALAAQGGVNTAGGMYLLTAGLDALMSAAVNVVLVPAVYVYLELSILQAAVGDDTVKRLRERVKSTLSWALKTMLYGYLGFLSVAGVVSGTADQAAVKAAKITISGAVPVVGSILSDASESILLGAAAVKNAVGIYGLTAVIAICLGPFLQIAAQYVLLKLTAMVCGLFAQKQAVCLVEDFSDAMGLLLAMTGTVGLLMLMSILCFLKGMG